MKPVVTGAEPGGPPLHVAIACGGTGGHLFPGLAVADELAERDARVTLLVSAKEVDQQAVRQWSGGRVLTLPAVALQGGNLPGFLLASWRATRVAAREFAPDPPDLVLAMGGFTSAPPVLAGQQRGALTFLHESNAIPGRANRWLAHVVDACFVGFPGAAARLWHPRVITTGTPVRRAFEPADAAACRLALGLRPDQPVLLVMGGSQGATGLNQLFLAALPALAEAHPELQFIHLTGAADLETARLACAGVRARSRVLPFFTEMELVLGAATLAVSRAGASSLAELAAMRLPALLVPFPAAADNHQFHNAEALVRTGAARRLDQRATSPAELARTVSELISQPARRAEMAMALVPWHAPQAAARIAGAMLDLARAHGRRGRPGPAPDVRAGREPGRRRLAEVS